MSSAPAAMQSDYEEDMPDLYMSQSTTSTRDSFYDSSSQPASASTKKRGYEDEIEDDMDSFFLEDDDIGEEPDAMRPIARMKSSSSRKTGTGQVHIVGHDDFEDAPFLVPMDVED